MGKPSGLGPSDLPAVDQPAAYLTSSAAHHEGTTCPRTRTQNLRLAIGQDVARCEAGVGRARTLTAYTMWSSSLADTGTKGATAQRELSAARTRAQAGMIGV